MDQRKLGGMPGSLIFVLGGAASGKSAYAETLVERLAPRRLYIASAQAFDAEMTDKIARHRARRGDGWRTVEAPLDVAGALAAAAPEEAVLFDCATLWLTNRLLAEADLESEIAQLVEALAQAPHPRVVVSNEVGQGIVPADALSRRFRAAQGALNQALAAAAEHAVWVVAGLPQPLKGPLP